ncbi:MAG: ATPase [Prevotella sp.]|nr:ATPase [Prevotella sp.]
MDIPFVFGKVADGADFTDRIPDTDRLVNNFRGLVNTVIISPRGWGKTSLVNHAMECMKDEKEYILCKVDIFNCRTEAQFYQTYVNAILRVSYSKMDEFIAAAKKYVGTFGPKLSLSDSSMKYELAFGIDFKDKQYSYDEILDLPQKIAEEKNRKFVVYIDEFQNVSTYDDSLGFQRKLRSHWQNHNKVGYCMYGSKRHMLLDIFSNYEMPFYKFGDVMFLEKISENNWVEYITLRFANTGKQIARETAAHLARRVECHPYYVQQLAQLAWLRTSDVCSKETVDDAFNSLVEQLSLLFSNIVDSLTARQINFLLAIVNGEKNFSSREVLQKYNLGTSANIKNLRKALQDKDLIDVMPNSTEMQDPVFAYWIKRTFG